MAQRFTLMPGLTLWQLAALTTRLKIKQWAQRAAENGAPEADHRLLACLTDTVNVTFLSYEYTSQDSLNEMSQECKDVSIFWRSYAKHSDSGKVL